MRTKFERKNSPLGAYLYFHLQKNGSFESTFQFASAFHKGHGRGKDLLNQIPETIKNTILSSVARLAITRAEKITSLLG